MAVLIELVIDMDVTTCFIKRFVRKQSLDIQTVIQEESLGGVDVTLLAKNNVEVKSQR